MSTVSAGGSGMVFECRVRGRILQARGGQRNQFEYPLSVNVMKRHIYEIALIQMALCGLVACSRNSPEKQVSRGSDAWTELNSPPLASASYEARVVAFLRSNGPLFQVSSEGLPQCESIHAPHEELEYFNLPYPVGVTDGYRFTIVISHKQWKYWVIRRGGIDGRSRSAFGPDSLSRYLPQPSDVIAMP